MRGSPTVFSATSLGELHISLTAGCSLLNLFRACLDTSKMKSLEPCGSLLARFPAMGYPIAPRPMKPTFSGLSI